MGSLFDCPELPLPRPSTPSIAKLAFLDPVSTVKMREDKRAEGVCGGDDRKVDDHKNET